MGVILCGSGFASPERKLDGTGKQLESVFMRWPSTSGDAGIAPEQVEGPTGSSPTSLSGRGSASGRLLSAGSEAQEAMVATGEPAIAGGEQITVPAERSAAPASTFALFSGR